MLRLLDEGFLAPASLEAVTGPRSELATERFLRNRGESNVVHYNFRSAQAFEPESSATEDELAYYSS